MSSQSNQSHELSRASAPMTGEDHFATFPAQLDELLERGEISLEAFALYTSMSAQLVAACRGTK